MSCTPGPWRGYLDQTSPPARPRYCIEGSRRGKPWTICFMDSDRADAHLITAAPELYEALEYWLEHQGDECADGFRSTDEHYCWEMRAMRQARAALAKARGEAE